MKKLSLKKTIFFLSSSLIGLLLVYGIIINSRIDTMGTHIAEVEYQYLPITENITAFTTHQLKQEIEFEKAAKYALTKSSSDKADAHFNHAISAYLKINSEIEETLNETFKILTSFKDNSIQSQLNSLKEKNSNWDARVQRVFQALRDGDNTLASSLTERVEEDALILEHDSIELLHALELLVEDSIHQLKEEEESVLSTGIIIVIISALIAAGLTHYITKNLTIDLNELKRDIHLISSGDLKTVVSSSLGLQFGLDKMQTDLHDTIMIIEESSNEILSASEELASISTTATQTAELQSQEIEHISAAMTQMTTASQEVAINAEKTQASTADVSDNATDSKKITSLAMTSISQLTTSLSSSSQVISELEKHSDNISSVLGVIKGIADQTNLLALNAAIEAARAGEQGRGFAVVADEVRTLAKRTQDSTIEIENMIELFSKGTSDAVSSIAECISHGESTHKATDDSNGKISDIQSAITEINDMNGLIAAAAEEQFCTTQELNQSTVRANELSQENTSTIAKVASAAVRAEEVSTALKDRLSKFSLH